MRKMSISQKRAIGYAVREKSEKKRAAFIVEKEGTLDLFKDSKYKTMHGYIKSKYNVYIY